MITPAQSRGARGILDWTQDHLATEAGVSLSTVKDFEAGRRTPIGNNLSAMRRAFEAGGIEFLDHGRPGVRLARDPDAVPATVSASKTSSRKKAVNRPAVAKPRRPKPGSK
jgi:DNA-binding XRE family transcriptional regulator